MKAYSELKEENLITEFVSHGTPVKIYIDNGVYTKDEARRLRAEFFLTLAGINTLPLTSCS